MTDLLAPQASSIPVVFRWDNDGQQWSYFLPGHQPLSQLSIPWFDTLNPGDPFFIYNTTSTTIDLTIESTQTATSGEVATNDQTETSTVEQSEPPSSGLDLALVEQYIFEITNEVRRENGVGELRRDSAIDTIARAHSRDMVERDFFAHVNPDGLDHNARAKAAGYTCDVGENISRQSTWNPIQEGFWLDEESLARKIVDSLMNSPGHRQNKLRATWDRMGVGVHLLRQPSGLEYVRTTENYSGVSFCPRPSAPGSSGATSSSSGGTSSSGSTAWVDPRTQSAGLDLALVEQYIFEITNEVRRENGVGEVSHDSDLGAIARTHSRDLVERDFWQQDNPHVNPDGFGPGERAKAAGYACGVGENISHRVTTWSSSLKGFHSEESLANKIVDSFMNSPGHRQNKLSAMWDRIGVGVHQVRLPSGWEAVWTTEKYGSCSASLDLNLVERYIFEITNGVRRENGVEELLRDADIDAIALAHSKDMVERDFLAHLNPDGLWPFERVDATGYPCGIGGNIDISVKIMRQWACDNGFNCSIQESIYTSPTVNFGQNSFHSEESLARKIVDDLLNGSNRRNKLGSGYGMIGVGVYIGRLDGIWEAVWVTEKYVSCPQKPAWLALQLDADLVSSLVVQKINERRSNIGLTSLQIVDAIPSAGQANFECWITFGFWRRFGHWSSFWDDNVTDEEEVAESIANQWIAERPFGQEFDLVHISGSFNSASENSFGYASIGFSIGLSPSITDCEKQLMPEPGTETGPESEPEVESEVGPEPESEPEGESEVEVESETDTESESDTGSESDAGSESTPESTSGTS